MSHNLRRRLDRLEHSVRSGLAVIEGPADATEAEQDAIYQAWRDQHPGQEPELVVYVRKFSAAFLDGGDHA